VVRLIDSYTETSEVVMPDATNTSGTRSQVVTASIERVDVTAERPSEGVERGTASSHLTFVAIDDDESVQSVPDLAVETAEERRPREAAMDAGTPPVP
jgi:acyl-CoA hydrolase